MMKYVLPLLLLSACAHPFTRGKVVPVDPGTKEALLREKAGCERMGGEFFVTADNTGDELTYSPICKLSRRDD